MNSIKLSRNRSFRSCTNCSIGKKKSSELRTKGEVAYLKNKKYNNLNVNKESHYTKLYPFFTMEDHIQLYINEKSLQKE